VSEHIETLEEIDIEYREIATEAGITNFRRVPALDTTPSFITGLANLVQHALEGPEVNLDQAAALPTRVKLISPGQVGLGLEQQLGGVERSLGNARLLRFPAGTAQRPWPASLPGIALKRRRPSASRRSSRRRRRPGLNCAGARRCFRCRASRATQSHFGQRLGPGGALEPHHGIDIAAPLGSPIRNWWSGAVKELINDTACGVGLLIQSGSYEHLYCHLAGTVQGVHLPQRQRGSPARHAPAGWGTDRARGGERTQHRPASALGGALRRPLDQPSADSAGHGRRKEPTTRLSHATGQNLGLIDLLKPPLQS